MKKYIFIFLILAFSSVVFVQADVSRIDQVMYTSDIQEESIFFSSPLTLGFSLYRMHMFFAYWLDVSSFTSYEHVRLIAVLKDMASYNVLELLEFEINKESLLDSYLSRLDSYILQSDLALSYLKEELSLLEYSQQHCLSQKKIADKQYLDAIQYPYQQMFLQESLENSKKNAQCASDAKIEYNAKKVLIDKITAYQSIIKVKYDYLSQHKEDIVDHYDLMKDDILERLILIKRMLEKYDL